jgi:predicted nucleic acid-binding protein
VERALDIACDFLLRGADAIYVALIAQLGATLVTLDKEILQPGRTVVPPVTPAGWLKEHPS